MLFPSCNTAQEKAATMLISSLFKLLSRGSIEPTAGKSEAVFEKHLRMTKNE